LSNVELESAEMVPLREEFSSGEKADKANLSTGLSSKRSGT